LEGITAVVRPELGGHRGSLSPCRHRWGEKFGAEVAQSTVGCRKEPSPGGIAIRDSGWRELTYDLFQALDVQGS
jgi:hypothetical protein